MPPVFWSRLSQREQILLMLGAAILLFVLVTILWPGGEVEEALPAPAIVSAPATPSAPPPDNDVVEPQRTAAAWPADFVLHGISAGTGGGAIMISIGTVPQRRVRLGRDVLPGWELTDVSPRAATVTAASGQTRRLSLVASDESGTASTPTQAASVNEQMATQDAIFTTLKLHLVEEEEGGRRGYRLSSVPPMLAAFGLQEGDMILRFDSDPFDSSERIKDLAYRIAEGDSGTVIYSRNGEERSIELPTR